MKNRRDNTKREKSAAVGLVVCFVAMIAIVGAVTFERYEHKEKPDAQNENTDIANNEGEENQEPSQTTTTDSVQAEIQKPIIEPEETPIQPAIPIAPKLSFAPNDTLMWPVDGNVIMTYSMETPIYFATLDQYKYHSALVISGEVGMDVISVAKGKVLSIETTAQTGTTLTLDIGSGYKAVYGQLKEVCVEKGDYLSEGDLIGHVSEPTKYYSIEGPNLYFQLLKDGQPVNPLEYLEV